MHLRASLGRSLTVITSWVSGLRRWNPAFLTYWCGNRFQATCAATLRLFQTKEAWRPWLLDPVNQPGDPHRVNSELRKRSKKASDPDRPPNPPPGFGYYIGAYVGAKTEWQPGGVSGVSLLGLSSLTEPPPLTGPLRSSAPPGASGGRSGWSTVVMGWVDHVFDFCFQQVQLGQLRSVYKFAG